MSLSLTYGLPVSCIEDPFIRSVATSFAAIGAAASPGKNLVNIIPILKYIPEWVPGVAFKREARELSDIMNRVKETLFKQVLEAMDNKTAPISFVSASLEHHKDQPDYQSHEFHTMEVATQVFGDREGYLSAILREVLRWNPPLPIGIPHFTTDDVYLGYYIPRDCVIITNVHAMFHNKEEFPNPNEFIPERFLTEDGTIRSDISNPFSVGTFGFGRRICPGSHIARSVLFIMAASILSLFDISPTLDANGKPVGVEAKFSDDSLFSIPLPLDCKITPRKGENVESLLKEYMGIDAL